MRMSLVRSVPVLRDQDVKMQRRVEQMILEAFPQIGFVSARKDPATGEFAVVIGIPVGEISPAERMQIEFYSKNRGVPLHVDFLEGTARDGFRDNEGSKHSEV